MLLMQSERNLQCRVRKKCNGFSEIIKIRQDVLLILKELFLTETHWITVNEAVLECSCKPWFKKNSRG